MVDIHYRVYHRQNEFARGKSHVNGIESFWSFAKRRLAKFNGLTSKYFALHLKECEFRFNHRCEDLLPILWAILKRCLSRAFIINGFGTPPSPSKYHYLCRLSFSLLVPLHCLHLCRCLPSATPSLRNSSFPQCLHFTINLSLFCHI